MTVIEDIRVTSVELNNDRLDVFWRFSDPEHSLAYEVHVKRSGAISGPYTKVAETFNAISFTDWFVDPDDFEKYWYQLEVVKRDTRELVQTTRQYTYASEPTVIGREVRRRNNLLLREHTGVPILYYPIRTEGMRCPECWGESEGQRVRSKCSNCFDTGWLLGYYNPLLMYMNIHADQQQLSENAETDRFAVRTGTGFIAGDIPIQFGDLVLEETNSRWAVSSYDKTEMLRSTVSFRIRLHQVIESDIRYRVPLPEAEIFERFVKSREYSRPYTLNPGGVQGVPR